MRLFRYRFRAMAAAHDLQLYADESAHAERVAAAAIAEVARIEAKYSRYRDDSVTTTINCAAGRNAVSIDGETASLLRYAHTCYQQSDGAFDITSGALRRAWDFKRKPPQLPSEAALAAARELIGWRQVEWNDSSVRLPRAGMEIDFGGIGKEYAADRVATLCQNLGCENALVNLGGDVRAAGPRADGDPWRVAIRHPRWEGAVIGTVELRGGAVATSGDYERYFELDGRRYCHILDPRTGEPVAYWQSVSVLAPLCVLAGTCATTAMLIGARAESFLRAQGLDYLMIAADGTRCSSMS